MILSPSASEATEARERGPPAKRISLTTFYLLFATILKVVAAFFTCFPLASLQLLFASRGKEKVSSMSEAT